MPSVAKRGTGTSLGAFPEGVGAKRRPVREFERDVFRSIIPFVPAVLSCLFWLWRRFRDRIQVFLFFFSFEFASARFYPKRRRSCWAQATRVRGASVCFGFCGAWRFGCLVRKRVPVNVPARDPVWIVTDWDLKRCPEAFPGMRRECEYRSEVGRRKSRKRRVKRRQVGLKRLSFPLWGI